VAKLLIHQVSPSDTLKIGRENDRLRTTLMD